MKLVTIINIAVMKKTLKEFSLLAWVWMYSSNVVINTTTYTQSWHPLVFGKRFVFMETEAKDNLVLKDLAFFLKALPSDEQPRRSCFT